MATHKFNDHLLNLSENKEIEKAIEEWRFVTKEQHEKLNRICVCQHRIKNVIYLFNILTRNTIAVGSTCFKKFNVTITDINPIIKKVLENIREKGEYKEILDFNKFIIDSEQDVIDSFQKEYRTYRDNIDELQYLIKYITDIINEYGISYLNDTLTIFEKRIQELQKERRELKERREQLEQLEQLERQERQKQKIHQEQEERRKQEERKKQKDHIQKLENEYRWNVHNLSKLEETKLNIEKSIEPYLEEIYNKITLRIHELQEERKEHERLQEIFRKKQLEVQHKREQEEKQERQRIQLLEEASKKEKEKCKCGLSFGSICKCKSPKYIIIPSNKQYSCKICRNWKDRCNM